MWYAILISIGIVLATVLSCRRAPLHGLTSEQVLNLVIISVPAGIIGARLYYVLFHWSWYSQDLIEILNTRAGGLAIHGGLIAGLGIAAISCHIQRIPPLSLLDLIAPSVALGQAIGRWGNYFNSEAHGGPTDLPWAITVDGQSVHPTFLYESIWCFLLFLFLLWFDRRQHKITGSGVVDASIASEDAVGTGTGKAGTGVPPGGTGSDSTTKKQPVSIGQLFLPFRGQIFLLYGILYSCERFFVEALRTDSLMLGPIKQAQLISLTAIVVMVIAYLALSRRQVHTK